MTLPVIRDAIVAAMSTAGLGDHVAGHPGRLSAADLKRVVARGRSTVLVGCLGVPDIELTSAGVLYTTAWAAYVLALHANGMDRDRAALTMIGAIGQIIPENLWGRDDLDSPKSIRADNLYGLATDQRGLALWAVSWRQDWMPEDVTLSALDDFDTFDATYDLDTSQDGEPTANDHLTNLYQS